jgi:hypothetical protein
MESTKNFKKVISDHLNDVADRDPLFAETLKKPNKNIDECVTYILNTVQKSGCNGFADDEIYSMALHYYDEDKIEVGKVNSGRVVINHKIELTEEDKSEAREKAKKEFEKDQLTELRKQQDRKEAKDKKKQEKLKAVEADKKTKKTESKEGVAMIQSTLF